MTSPLVVAYPWPAGSTRIWSIAARPRSRRRARVLARLWPSPDEIACAVADGVRGEMFAGVYADVQHPRAHGATRRSTSGVEEALGGPLTVRVAATSPGGARRELEAVVRVDTPQEAEYYRHGGICPTCCVTC